MPGGWAAPASNNMRPGFAPHARPSPPARRRRARALGRSPPPARSRDLETRARTAESAAARGRFIEERAAAELELARAEKARAEAQAGVTYSVVTSGQREAIERELAAIAEQAEQLDTPPDLSGLAAARGAAEAAVASLTSSAGDYIKVTARLGDWRQQVTSVRDEWAAALANIAASARAAGLDAPPDPAPGATIPELDAQREALATLFAERASPEEEPALRTREGATGAELDQIAAARDETDREHARLTASISATLAGVDVAANGDEPLEKLAARWPPLGAASELDDGGGRAPAG